jgi:hypothetical protein
MSGWRTSSWHTAGSSREEEEEDDDDEAGTKLWRSFDGTVGVAACTGLGNSSLGSFLLIGCT